MENDLRTKLQEAKSCCENEILSAIKKFSETTGLKVENIEYKEERYGEWVSQRVEINYKNMSKCLVTTFLGVDLSKNEPDYASLSIIDLKDKTIENRIIRTDNPDPNSWLKKFLRNEQETKEQEPSDEDRREQNLRNAEKDRCV